MNSTLFNPLKNTSNGLKWKNWVPGFFETGRFKTSKKKKKKTRSSLSWKKMHIFFILVTLTAPLINTRFAVKVILFPILSDG